MTFDLPRKMKPHAPPLRPPAIALALDRSLGVCLGVSHAWRIRPREATNDAPRVPHWMADASAKSFGVVLFKMPAVPPKRNPVPAVVRC
jgi:hypothetical protein